ncbi:hypothetical protein [Bacillus sp. HU-1818]|uniref:hypothetical protein n=1 Tax=Bacillus sp. HU-1818 TaxID=2704469 RepID=UPI001F5DC46C|nr:hypothetical protein [Bacillus sp. HU-1818]
MKTEKRAKAGIAYIPQWRAIFTSLTVRYNLLLGEGPLSRKDRTEQVREDIFQYFLF